MAMSTLGRRRLIAAPMMAAMVTLAVPTAAQAAGAPGTTDRTTATQAQAPSLGITGAPGATRRFDVTIRSLDDIRGAIA